MGRPPKEINQENFESLCKIQCTLSEIAGFFKCCEDTIEKWCKTTYGDVFSAVYKKYSQDGKISLRRLQFRIAEKSATMAIWLGKQYLNQSDKQEIVASTESKDTLIQYLEAIKSAERRKSDSGEV